jgi:hypothetical protein
MIDLMKREGQFGTSVVAVVSVLVALLLYVFSLGPFERLVDSRAYPSLAQAEPFIYAPLIWAAETSPPLRDALGQYIRFWTPAHTSNAAPQ